MTFTVVSINEASERVVATVWADAEPQAEALAASLFSASERAVQVRRTDDREIPMRVAAELPFTSPFVS